MAEKETESMIKLGAKVRDKITGFGGVAIARTEWLYGCIRYAVKSQSMKDEKPIAEEWFDEPQLVVLQMGMEAKATDRPGGPRPKETG